MAERINLEEFSIAPAEIVPNAKAKRIRRERSKPRCSFGGETWSCSYRASASLNGRPLCKIHAAYMLRSAILEDS